MRCQPRTGELSWCRARAVVGGTWGSGSGSGRVTAWWCGFWCGAGCCAGTGTPKGPSNGDVSALRGFQWKDLCCRQVAEAPMNLNEAGRSPVPRQKIPTATTASHRNTRCGIDRIRWLALAADLGSSTNIAFASASASLWVAWERGKPDRDRSLVSPRVRAAGGQCARASRCACRGQRPEAPVPPHEPSDRSSFPNAQVL